MIKFLKKYRYDIAIGLIILIFALLGYLFKDSFSFLSSQQALENFVLSYGSWAPVVLIIIIVIEVIIAPLPGIAPPIVAGFIFGPWLGSLYTYIGSFIGTLAVFYLARRFGRVLIKNLFRKKTLEKYEKAIARHENFYLAFYFFPFFPLDVITAAFGLSAIGWKKFITVMSIGYVFYVLILSLFGDYLARLFL